MDKMVFGILEDENHAKRVIDELEAKGLDPKEFSVITRDYEDKGALSGNTGSKVSQGAISGATTGGVLGGLAGLLIGIGAITIPGAGALLIGGPIATALGLTGATAATFTGALTGIVAGGLVGIFTRLGIPQKKAELYEQRIKEGGMLLIVPTNDALMVEKVMHQHQATEVHTAVTNDQLDLTDKQDREVNKGKQSKRKTKAEDTVVVNPVQVQKFLDGIDYPATKDELVGYAVKKGADENVRETLQSIANRRYKNPKQVSEAIGKIK